VSLVQPLAANGDVKAQYSLGVLYYRGEGVPQDYAESARWYRKAAEQGYADAQYCLGFMYTNGYGVPKNLVEAYKWCTIAAEKGHAMATKN